MKKIFFLSCTIFLHLSAMNFRDAVFWNVNRCMAIEHSFNFNRDIDYRNPNCCFVCWKEVHNEPDHFINCPQSQHDNLINLLKDYKTMGTESTGQEDHWQKDPLAFAGAVTINLMMFSSQIKFYSLYRHNRRITGYDYFSKDHSYRCNVCSISGLSNRMHVDALIDHVDTQEHKKNVSEIEQKIEKYKAACGLVTLSYSAPQVNL